MWTCFSISVFAWGQAKSKLGGVDTSILHHVFMLIFIALWIIISLYNTIRMPFLSYFASFTWRGRMPAAGILAWKWSKFEIPILRNSKCRKNQRWFFSHWKTPYSRRWASEGHQGGHEVGGRAQWGMAHPHPRGQGVAPLVNFLRSVFFIYSENDFREVSGLLELCRIGL